MWSCKDDLLPESVPPRRHRFGAARSTRLRALLCPIGVAAAMFGHAALAQTPTPRQPTQTQPAAAPAEPRFDILEYEIEGNTVLDAAAIERAVTPFLGPQRQLGDADAARGALEKAYQDAGFLTVFVDVPEQRVDGGVVRLHVQEGRVERLSVTGSRYFSQGYIRAKVPEFAEGQVPNFTEAQRQLALVNRSEERRVQPVLRPGPLPGTVEVDLKVADELPLSGSVEVTNEHAPNTDPMRLSATLRYDNLFQRDHSLAITAITAPTAPSQSSVLVANYTVPLDSGTSLVGYGVVSDSQVESLGGTTVFGKGFTLGLRYVLPFGVVEGSSHTLSVGADYKDLKERVAFGTDNISTPLRYLPMQASYNGVWSGDGRLSQLGITATVALRKLLQRDVDCPGTVGPVDQFACKRQGADGGFATLKVDARHNEPAPFGSLVALRLSGQLATDPLASSEQFSVGGAETVRGYLNAESSGDRGVLGSIEWRSANVSGRVGGWFGGSVDERPAEGRTPLLSDLSFLGFVDAARVYTIEPSFGQVPRMSMLGAGVGIRLSTRKAFDASLDLAWPMKRTFATPELDPRLHVRVRYRF